MKKHKNIFDQFREKGHSLSEQPSPRAWDRLERRLDNRPRSSTSRTFRWLGIAASLAVLVTALAALSWLMQLEKKDRFAMNNAIPSHLEDLQWSDQADFKAVQVRYTYQNRGSNPLPEGSSDKKLIAKINQPGPEREQAVELENRQLAMNEQKKPTPARKEKSAPAIDEVVVYDVVTEEDAVFEMEDEALVLDGVEIGASEADMEEPAPAHAREAMPEMKSEGMAKKDKANAKCVIEPGQFSLQENNPKMLTMLTLTKDAFQYSSTTFESPNTTTVRGTYELVDCSYLVLHPTEMGTFTVPEKQKRTKRNKKMEAAAPAAGGYFSEMNEEQIESFESGAFRISSKLVIRKVGENTFLLPPDLDVPSVLEKLEKPNTHMQGLKGVFKRN